MGRILISICGGSGSGNSTIAKHLMERLGPEVAARIPTDFYLKPNPYPSLAEFFKHPLPYDWDLLETTLQAADGMMVSSPDYDFVHFQRISNEGGRSFILRPILITDAMFPYPGADLTIITHCPEIDRKRRIIERDQRWKTQVIHYWDQHQITLAELMRMGLAFDLELDGMEAIEKNVEQILSLPLLLNAPGRHAPAP